MGKNDIFEKLNQLWDEEQEDLFFRIFTLTSKNTDTWETSSYPHRIDGVAVCICLAGEAQIFIDHKGYLVKQNEMFLLFPGAVFQTASRSEDFVGYMVGAGIEHTGQLDFAAALPLYFHIRENPCITLDPEDVDVVVELGDTIKKKVRRLEHPYRKEIAHHLILSLFYEISSIYQRGQPTIQKSRKRDDELFEQFLFLVTQHCRRERRLEFYAQQMFLTPKYLSSVVKQVSGQSASQWISQVLIVAAKGMLHTSGLTVQQISNELNFPNPSFFGQYFKKYTGLTPKAYRQNR